MPIGDLFVQFIIQMMRQFELRFLVQEGQLVISRCREEGLEEGKQNLLSF